MLKLIFIVSVFYIQSSVQKSRERSIIYFQPEQIHLAYGDSTAEITVTWSTFNDTEESVVEYGIGGFIARAEGSSVLYNNIEEGWGRPQYIHKVKLENLFLNSTYVYHCGSQKGWSQKYTFNTPPPNENWQPFFAIYGDMGNENPQSLARLQKETQQGMYDAIFHIGDFAYNMDDEGGEVGNQFMRQIEAVAAYIPYHTCPGNHESAFNFSHYKAHFNMPGDPDSFMHSINVGPLHVVFISTEVYYFMNYGIKSLVLQYEWLEEDLAIANLPENRAKQPWIIVMGHRPMYCSDDDGDDCSHHETITRVGIPFLHYFGLEELLYNYGVDLEFWAHEHSYERLWPLYDYKIYNGSYEEPYRNPKAPVHIITGSAGCKEKTDNFVKNPPEWSAFRSSDYGYTRLKAYNATHLYIEQVSDDKDGAIIDSLWLIKDHHTGYAHSKMNWNVIDKVRLRNLNL